MPPCLAAELAPDDRVALGTDAHWEAIAVRADFSGQVAEDIEISGCRLTSTSFSGAQLPRARLSDTVFERCDLSAAVLSQATLTRVEFADCRLSGADLSGARLQDVLFSECRLVDVNLRMAAGARVRFDGCNLAGAGLYAAQLPGACLFDSDLTGAELSRANLVGGRLHGSALGALKGAAALRGTTVSSAQVMAVALQVLGVLEINIDDEREPPVR
jgi:uncharacterized protein YjbI with pentapeptide repeats